MLNFYQLCKKKPIYFCNKHKCNKGIAQNLVFEIHFKYMRTYMLSLVYGIHIVSYFANFFKNSFK